MFFFVLYYIAYSFVTTASTFNLVEIVFGLIIYYYFSTVSQFIVYEVIF